MMDDLADRAPLFAAFFIHPARDKVMKMVHMESIAVPNCDSTINKTGCYDLVRLMKQMPIYPHIVF